jgi:hypothetical protein
MPAADVDAYADALRYSVRAPTAQTGPIYLKTRPLPAVLVRACDSQRVLTLHQGTYVPNLWNPPIGAAHWVYDALARDTRVGEARMHFLADGLHTSTVDVNSVDEWPRRGDDLFLGLLRACPQQTVDGRPFC